MSNRLIGCYTSPNWKSGISFMNVRKLVFSQVEHSGGRVNEVENAVFTKIQKSIINMTIKLFRPKDCVVKLLMMFITVTTMM